MMGRAIDSSTPSVHEYYEHQEKLYQAFVEGRITKKDLSDKDYKDFQSRNARESIRSGGGGSVPDAALDGLTQGARNIAKVGADGVVSIIEGVPELFMMGADAVRYGYHTISTNERPPGEAGFNPMMPYTPPFEGGGGHAAFEPWSQLGGALQRGETTIGEVAKNAVVDTVTLGSVDIYERWNSGEITASEGFAELGRNALETAAGARFTKYGRSNLSDIPKELAKDAKAGAKRIGEAVRDGVESARNTALSTGLPSGGRPAGNARSTRRITTPNAQMREAAQGTYRDPLDNVVKATDDVLPADHIFPKKEITRLPGYDQLTREQKAAVLNNLRNTQGLPRPYNSSKGAKTDWSTYKGKPLDPEYRDWLAKEQQDIKSVLQEQINEFLGERSDD